MTAPNEWLAALERDGGAIAATSPERLDLDVPTCPGWTVRDLVVHLGGVHRWAATFLAEGPDSTTRFAPIEDDAPSGAAVTGWYRDRLDGLLRELRRHAPDEPARAFIGRVTAAFWMRRQALETAVHRWDAENAWNAAAPVESVLAGDGIEEWAQVFAGRFLSRGPGLPDELVGRTVHLHGTDRDDAEWTLALDRQAVTVERGHAKGDAALRGATSDVYLALWRRVPVTRLETFGDGTVVPRLLDAVQVT
ncbi:maleylpyruvate isomerase family mycothiol-dependent enzyme [Tsukamurella paurometabola]|uniref:Maleylpyruvate isomerase family mycothiol-dependent enzyme n=1 Tax=Tsukamurella paurometabola TaxID=2061 RepID=A0ABS5N7R2_TSUPA|nr:maleylpyruvate isomerase family mycothiol-dependent enzyme [Tsukamurella paurometabola]MBS4100322.1 maleylpyruvate isomerase family mycothiol-dependent enzyme [Tsukamurella paurometabola]